MLQLSDEEIGKSLKNLVKIAAVGRYCHIQATLMRCDVSKDRQFQKSFSSFYRVRRDSEWRKHFFELMEVSKLQTMSFADTLRKILASTGRIEASFASKLVATIDPTQPVVDSVVLRRFGLRLPIWGAMNRVEKTAEIYRQLCLEYEELLKSPSGIRMRTMFDQQFAEGGISEIKKIDLVFWQTRTD